MPLSSDQLHAHKPGRRGAPRRHGRALAIAAVTLPLITFAACGSSRPEAAKVTESTLRTNSTKASHPAHPTTTVPPATTTTTTAPAPAAATSTTTAPTTTTTPTAEPAPTAATPTTALPTLAPPTGGLIAGHVTAVGDSVMLDYQADLETDIPGVDVEAAVSRQWSEGEQVLQQLRTEGRLGAVVVVALGTNGPITDADFDSMMSVLAGASRVVFVTIVVDRPWQDPNNEVLRDGVARYANTVIADWSALEAQNPEWVYSDGTHLPIGGPGTQALAALIAAAV